MLVLSLLSLKPPLGAFAVVRLRFAAESAGLSHCRRQEGRHRRLSGMAALPFVRRRCLIIPASRSICKSYGRRYFVDRIVGPWKCRQPDFAALRRACAAPGDTSCLRTLDPLEPPISHRSNRSCWFDCLTLCGEPYYIERGEFTSPAPPCPGGTVGRYSRQPKVSAEAMRLRLSRREELAR